MIKYKVKDAANDFALPNKKITEILKKHCNVDKKTMTTLTESELDVLFDVLTKEHAVKDFNAYFAVRNAKLEQAQEPVKEEPKEDKKPAADKTAAKKDGKEGKEGKPAPAAKPAQPKEQKGESPNHQRKRKVIDTRATNVDVERYNSKYDDLASDTSKSRSTDRDHTTKKQKFSNRTQKQRGRKQGKRETEAERLKRIAMERKQKPITVQIPDEITVNELALRLKATVAEVVKKAFLMGTMVTATDTIDFDTASLIAMEFHAKVEKEVVVTIEEKLIDDSEDDEANLIGRAPVVVVMGHVDHGKTSILDAIRHANVTAGEAGGITQHIGAYRVQVNGKPITFLDTPGHEAFTTMRARGAQVTDIAILVVAADDGIMPQTVEAINHAKAAGVSVIVAINKMDKVGANPEQVKQQLTEYELIPEEWGGDTPCIPVSAKTKEGLDDLLEMVALVAEMKELKANPDRAAKGTVIEANLFDQLRLGEVKELQIIVKADVQGSVEAVRQSLEKLSNEEVRVNVIHGAVGAINESDVMLAEASSAIIVGFNVRPDAVAASHAESAGVDMRLYSVIYDCINEIESAMKGMLAPKTREVVLGMAECRNVIKIKSVGTIAGSYVKSGVVQRGGGVRVIRDGIVIAEDKIGSLQRFKDAVKEVKEGYECGIGLEKFNDLKEGDMFEVYTIEEYRD